MLVKLKIVLFIAIGLALPVLLYQLWAFIVPGLTSREKKWSDPVRAVVVLPVPDGGAVRVLHAAARRFGFLLGFAGPGVVSLLTFDRYVSFVMLVALAFGLSFLLPVLLVFLELVGVVSPQWLSKNRRYSLVPHLLVRGDHHAELRPVHDDRDGGPDVPVLRGGYHHRPLAKRGQKTS